MTVLIRFISICFLYSFAADCNTELLQSEGRIIVLANDDLGQLNGIEIIVHFRLRFKHHNNEDLPNHSNCKDGVALCPKSHDF